MILSKVLQARFDLGAKGVHLGAAGMEPAVGQQVNGVRSFALQDHPLPAEPGVGRQTLIVQVVRCHLSTLVTWSGHTTGRKMRVLLASGLFRATRIGSIPRSDQ